LVAVTPQPGHLAQLRDRVTMLTIDDGKAAKVAESFDGPPALIAPEPVEFDMTLDHAAVSALIRMGPTARHLSSAGLAQQVGTLPEVLTVTASVTVSVLSPVSEPDGKAVPHPG
jgi:23S rRNA (guanine745-N1)-methyltransferase